MNHDAKTPTDNDSYVQVVGQMPNQDQENPGQDFIVRVVHLLGGQTLIGQMLKRSGGQVPFEMRYPCEVLVIPPSDTQKPTVIVTRLGTCAGMVPALGTDLVNLDGKMLCRPFYPPSPILGLYLKTVGRYLFPDAPEYRDPVKHPNPEQQP